jgi:hypothetical protein
MNAPVSIEQTLPDPYRSAIGEVNCWRGCCVNHFARGELAIGRALQAAAPGKKLPMLLSQKFEALRKLCPDGSKKQKAIVDFGAISDDRNSIVHGEGRVYIDHLGNWVLSLRSLNRDSIRTTYFLEAEAEDFRNRLKRVVHQLCGCFPA